MDSKQVIRSYLVITSLYTLSASLIWGVNTLFLLNSGLDIFGVFFANAVFTGAMVVFEIPTGVVADTTGRRASFLLSTAVLCLGTLGYVGVSLAGGSLFWFCLMSVFLGLGFAFYSGAVEAWLVDALQATNYEGELDRVFARAGVVAGALMLVGTIAGGFLGSLHLAIPYLGRALLLALVCGWGYLYMHEIGYTPRALKASAIPVEMRKIARESITFGWKKLPVRLIMIVTFVQGLFLIWGFYATQPYFLDLLGQPDAVWVSGVVTALVSLTGIIGNGLVNRYMIRFSRRTTILIATSLIFTLANIAVGLVSSFWVAVPLFLLGSLVSSIFTPIRQSYLHQLIPSAQRATVISFNSMMDSAGGVIGQPALGYLSERAGIGTGFVAGGAATFFVIPFLFLLRRLKDPADRIRPGDELPPAGVPEVMAADEG